MQPFTTHRGLVATLDRANVDTDQIIPKQFLKRIERTGFGEFLFYDWRYRESSQKPGELELNPDFELNRPEFAGATILLARRNFGSGSSREHAVWALADYGFRAVLAPSFADIFYNNCFKNGLLPVSLAEETIQQLFDRIAAQPGYQLVVDLTNCQVYNDRGWRAEFSIDASRRERLLNGWDDIAMTLRHEDKIARYEAQRGIAPPSASAP